VGANEAMALIEVISSSGLQVFLLSIAIMAGLAFWRSGKNKIH